VGVCRCASVQWSQQIATNELLVYQLAFTGIVCTLWALLYKPCNCFLLSPPLSWYWCRRLWTKDDSGCAFSTACKTSRTISTSGFSLCMMQWKYAILYSDIPHYIKHTLLLVKGIFIRLFRNVLLYWQRNVLFFNLKVYVMKKIISRTLALVAICTALFSFAPSPFSLTLLLLSLWFLVRALEVGSILANAIPFYPLIQFHGKLCQDYLIFFLPLHCLWS